MGDIAIRENYNPLKSSTNPTHMNESHDPDSPAHGYLCTHCGKIFTTHRSFRSHQSAISRWEKVRRSRNSTNPTPSSDPDPAGGGNQQADGGDRRSNDSGNPFCERRQFEGDDHPQRVGPSERIDHSSGLIRGPADHPASELMDGEAVTFISIHIQPGGSVSWTFHDGKADLLTSWYESGGPSYDLTKMILEVMSEVTDRPLRIETQRPEDQTTRS